MRAAVTQQTPTRHNIKRRARSSREEFNFAKGPLHFAAIEAPNTASRVNFVLRGAVLPPPRPPMARSAAPTLDIEEADTFLYPCRRLCLPRVPAFDDQGGDGEPQSAASTADWHRKDSHRSVFMYNMLRWFPDGIVVFMAPTRPLVAQQVKARAAALSASPPMSRRC